MYPGNLCLSKLLHHKSRPGPYNNRFHLVLDSIFQHSYDHLHNVNSSVRLGLAVHLGMARTEMVVLMGTVALPERKLSINDNSKHNSRHNLAVERTRVHYSI